jgi:hypothetical protein
VSREPTLDDLIGADESGAERQRLQHVHELLLEAGPPPELSPELEGGPTLGMTLARPRRRKPRALLLLAAALAVALVFFAGYSVRSNKSGKQASTPVVAVSLTGTRIQPQAEGALRIWNSKDGSNWPMTLTVAGLPQLPPHSYYEVYLFRGGKIQGSCGMFRIGESGASGSATVTLTSPYQLEPGDTWVVTRPGAGGAEPGPTVLRPVTT